MEITCVTIDCSAPGRLAEFWSGALGWKVTHSTATGAFCTGPDEGFGLEFIRVDEVKASKNRVHLGTRTHDVDAEIERLLALGASVAWEERLPDGWPYRNVVLRDPEGNEFCLGDHPR